MADVSIHNFLSSRDPQLNFRWRAKGTKDSFGIDPKYVERVTVPWSNFDSMPIYVQGSNKFYHSVNDHDSVSIAFYVDTNLTVIDAMQKWIKKIYKDGRYGLPIDYKKNFSVELLDNNEETPIAEFKIEGAWPSSIDGLELNYNSSERLILTVTLTVDQISFMNASESGALGPPSPESSIYENLSRGSALGGGINGDGVLTNSGIQKGFLPT